MRFLLVLAALLTASAQESAPSLPALLDSANAAYLKGDYETARQCLLRAQDLADETPFADPVRYGVLKRLAAVRSAAGEFAEADEYLGRAMDWREIVYGPLDGKLGDDLLQAVQFARALKDYDRALNLITAAMEIHRRIDRAGTETEMFADDISRLGQIQMERKQVANAITAFDTALAIRANLKGPLDRTLVPDLDRLAGAHIAERTYDKAEQTYRRALVIRETLEGRDDPDLIATVDGLAYACFGQKKFDEAEALYHRLIGLWVKSVGEDHPMVAIALEKVARFYSEQKKYDQAREAVDRGDGIRAHFLAEGLAAAAAQRLVEGRKDDAIELYRRALAALDSPEPTWAETRAEIEAVVKTLTRRAPVKK